MPEENDNDTLRIKVSVGDTTVEVEGPVGDVQPRFDALREEYLIPGATGMSTNQDPSGRSESNGGTTQSTISTGKQRTLGEFYRQTDNLSKKDTALLTGWYLEIKEEIRPFTSEEVEEKGKQTKMSLGANVSRDLSSQVENGYLGLEEDEMKGKSGFYVTLTGEEYVENELLAGGEA